MGLEAICGVDLVSIQSSLQYFLLSIYYIALPFLHADCIVQVQYIIFLVRERERECVCLITMEACFLSSTFSKTMESLSPLRERMSTFKKCSKFHTRKFGAPSLSVACCLSRDEEGPHLRADWRAFRARLVAQQRAPPQQEEEEELPAVVIGDKWAHKIYEPEKGCLLIATEKLDGVHIFERTVILLLSTGPAGPTGLILNRPSLMSIKEMPSAAAEELTGPFAGKALFFGGPIEEGLFLVSPGGGGGEGVERSGVLEKVMKGVYYGTRESAGCAAEMVKRSVVEAEEFRFFHGYCAWEREQLRDEIRAGYWTVAACSPAVIGLTSVGSVGLWEEILGLMGPKKVS